jgi:Zn-dependent protease
MAAPGDVLHLYYTWPPPQLAAAGAGQALPRTPRETPLRLPRPNRSWGLAAATWVASVLLLLPVFGPWFSVGVMTLVGVHELGHMLFARLVGAPASPPVFVGPLGAFVMWHRRDGSSREAAIVAMGGPLIGAVGALFCLGAALLLPDGSPRAGLLGISLVVLLLNVLNLLPAPGLDGGVIATALNRSVVFAGLVAAFGVVVALVLVARLDPVALMVAAIALVSAVRVLRRRRAASQEVAPAPARVWIGVAYVGMLLGMTLATGVASLALVAPGVRSFRQQVDGGARPVYAAYDQTRVSCATQVGADCRSDLSGLSLAAQGLAGRLEQDHPPAALAARAMALTAGLRMLADGAAAASVSVNGYEVHAAWARMNQGLLAVERAESAIDG